MQELNPKGNKNKTSNLTPMLQQYRDIKSRYPDAILFFHIGDFYEMFLDDAEIASRVLEITLTSRNRHEKERIPMCGVPVHAAENYLTRLVRSGYRVAICEQTEDPRKARGLVRREVVRVVTPGLITTEGSIGAKANNFLVSIKPGVNRGPWGLSYLDISTGEFRVTELPGVKEVLAELFRLEPAEVLLPEGLKKSPLVSQIRQAIPEAFLSFRPDLWWQNDRSSLDIKRHLKTLSLDGFGLREFSSGIGAAGALLSYTIETQKEETSHINCLRPYHLNDYLIIDEATKRNLELLTNSLDHGRHGTLLEVLDLTVTPMGGRLLKKWILYPLKDISKIQNRLSAVEALKDKASVRKRLIGELRKVHDLERLLARTILGTANGRDLLALKGSIIHIPEIKEILEGIIADIQKEALDIRLLREICSALDPLQDIAEIIESSMRDDCPIHLREGRLIKEGFRPELDELIHIQRDGRSFIAGIEARERERTKIPSLKVGFNRVFGYYIEVSKARASEVPKDYIRKQTLVSTERYITPELKEIESKILTAQETRQTLEYEIFQDIRHQVAAAGPRIQGTAAAIARLDCLSSLAEAADLYRYVRPELDQGQEISIRQGRHPVLEYAIKEAFIPNDIDLNQQDSQLIIITGPNMAGKSTVLRQTALIVLMAQMGSFVPAEAARIGIVDQIFTRVGATDYLTHGQSTFMVEMSETANILHNAGSRSLVILDEIGRGTSTYDGLAIAWAVAEHLLKTGIKTLFATHYHELTELTKRHRKVHNMHMAIKEWEGQIVFLRRLIDGAASRSYGIQVAALAGIPEPVIKRAKEVLKEIEKKASINKRAKSIDRVRPKGYLTQMSLPLIIDQGAEIRERLYSIDINNITPIEALNYLSELKSMAKKNQR